MKTLILALSLCLAAVECALATPQANDTIVIGGNTYGIFQFPMLGYWHFENEAARGRVPFPKFEATSSANWRGYIAEWSISRGRLYLLSIDGQIAGKKVQDREIIKKRFPLRATWFTGKIFVSVGDFDDDKHAFEYVLEFNVSDGNVTSTSFHESFKIPMTWNGLPDDRPPLNDGTEPTDARETSSTSSLNAKSTPRSP